MHICLPAYTGDCKPHVLLCENLRGHATMVHITATIQSQQQHTARPGAADISVRSSMCAKGRRQWLAGPWMNASDTPTRYSMKAVRTHFRDRGLTTPIITLSVLSYGERHGRAFSTRNPSHVYSARRLPDVNRSTYYNRQASPQGSSVCCSTVDLDTLAALACVAIGHFPVQHKN